MCYYIQKVHNFELLKMRAEFSKDENGTVGSKTDILKRTENLVKNSYNSKKQYNRHPTT